MMPDQSPEYAVEQLLPCPFCGGEASGEGRIRYGQPLADTWWEDGSEITEAFYVNCIKCGCANGRLGLVGGYQTKDEAVARWNARHREESAAVYRQAIEAAIAFLTNEDEAGFGTQEMEYSHFYERASNLEKLLRNALNSGSAGS